MTSVLVLGASGKTGHAVSRALAARGVSVRPGGRPNIDLESGRGLVAARGRYGRAGGQSSARGGGITGGSTWRSSVAEWTAGPGATLTGSARADLIAMFDSYNEVGRPATTWASTVRKSP